MSRGGHHAVYLIINIICIAYTYRYPSPPGYDRCKAIRSQCSDMWIFCEMLCAVAVSVFSIQISKFVSGIFKLSGKRLKKFQHKVEIYFSMYSSPQYAASCWPLAGPAPCSRPGSVLAFAAIELGQVLRFGPFTQSSVTADSRKN